MITYPDGRVIREPYTHRYRGFLRKYERHPCDLYAEVQCPVEVPGVVGLELGAAAAALDAAGFLWSVTYVDDDENIGKVVAATPGGKQVPGTTIHLTVGE